MILSSSKTKKAWGAWLAQSAKRANSDLKVWVRALCEVWRLLFLKKLKKKKTKKACGLKDSKQQELIHRRLKM